MRDVPQSPRQLVPDGRILTVPAALCDRETLSEHRDTKPARTLTGVGEPPAVPTGTTQLVLVPQPPPVQPVNR